MEEELAVRCRRLNLCLAFFFAMLIAVATAPPAAATGYWNVPSSVCQCMGYGYGAGYHAPLVLGPISCDGWLARNEQRLPYTPCSPTAWYDCGDCGGNGRERSFVAPSILPPASPALAPARAAYRPPYRR